MIKKIISAILSATIVFGCIPAALVHADDSVIYYQSFKNLTEIPEGWTANGTEGVNYRFNEDSIGTYKSSSGKFGIKSNEEYDTFYEPYSVSFGLSHYGGQLNYVHIGASSPDYVGENKVAADGYTISFKPTTDYKSAVIRIYKDGTEIGTLEDTNTSYGYQTIRTFTLTVTPEMLVVSGAGSRFEYEDYEPIYAGYIGAHLNDTTSNGKSRISEFKVSKLLAVTETNLSYEQAVDEEISVLFNYAPAEATVTKANVYITDIDGNKIPDESYNLSVDGDRIIISFNTPLLYETSYNLVIGGGVATESGTSMGADATMFFRTQEPPFYIKPEKNGESVDVTVGNTYFSKQKAYVFVTALDSDNSVVSAGMSEIQIPGIGTDSCTVEFDIDVTDYELNVFCLDKNYLPLLVNKEEKFEAEQAETVISGNTLVVSGASPSGKANAVYMIVTEKDSDEFVTAATATGNGDGNYSLSLSLDNAEPGYYTLTISGNDFKKAITKDFYFATKEMKDEGIYSFNSVAEMDEEEAVGKVAEYIDTYIEILSLSNNVYEEIKDECADDIAGKLYGFIKETPVEADDGEDIRRVFKLSTDLVAAESGYVEKITESAGFADMDSQTDATITSIYESKLTESAREAVAGYVANNSYSSYEDVYTAFAEAVVINAINGYDGGTGSHIGDVLKNNAVVVGLDLEEYNNATNKEAINTYIYEAGVLSVEDIANAIAEAISVTDQSLYSHTFTTADIESSDWSFDQKLITDNGVVLASGTTEVISEFDVKGNFELGGSFTREYNYLYYLFDYKDSKNYSYVAFYLRSADVQHTAIARVTDGETKEYANISGGSYSGMKVLVEEDGYVTVLTSADAAVISRTYTGAPFDGGKVGVRLKDSKGSIKKITIQHHLDCKIVMPGPAVGIETESIDVKFNYPVKINSVNSENIKIFENGKEFDGYTIAAAEDGKSFRVGFAQKLNYKSVYEIAVSGSIKAAVGNARFVDECRVGFKTENPEFNAVVFKGVYNGEGVFVNDMTVAKEFYISEKSLTELKGKSVDLSMALENSGASRNVAVIFTLENENGAVLWSSGIMNVTVGAENTVTSTAVIPSAVTEQSRFGYIVLDSASGMHSAYPYYANEATAAGDKPSVSKNGAKINIIGKTPSGMAGKNVNILVMMGNKVVKATSMLTDENGKYSLAFDVNEAYVASSGNLDVKVGGEEFSAPVTESVYFALKADRNNAVEAINDRNDTKNALEEYKDVLGLTSANDEGIVLYNSLTDAEKAEVATLVASAKPYSQTDGAAQLLEKTLECIVLVCFANEKEELLFRSDGEYLTDDIIDFSSLNTYKIYNENLTENGKNKVRDSLLGAECKTVSELYTEYARAVVTAGINNWTLSGFGHIESLLTSNASEAKLDISKYKSSNSKSEFNRSLISNPVSDFEDLQSRLNNIQNNPGGASSGGGGGGGGGSSSGSSKGSSNGGFNSSSKSSFVSEAPTAVQPPAENKLFGDISGYEWAEEAIAYLSENKIVNGYDDGTFRPGNKLMREEFVTLIVKAFGLTAKENNQTFSDVSADSWYYPYVLAACSNGIIQGYDGKFGAGEPVTRQDAVVILGRVLEMNGVEINAADSIGAFDDAAEISDYAQNAFNYFVSNGIINGTDGNKLAPKADCRRAEMAKMLYSVIK